MKRIAAPMVGGTVSATLLTLVVMPAIFSVKGALAQTARASRLVARRDIGILATAVATARRAFDTAASAVGAAAAAGGTLVESARGSHGEHVYPRISVRLIVGD